MAERNSAASDFNNSRAKSTPHRRPNPARRALQSQTQSTGGPAAPWDLPSPQKTPSPNEPLVLSPSAPNDLVVHERSTDATTATRRGRSNAADRTGDRASRVRRDGRERWSTRRPRQEGREKDQGGEVPHSVKSNDASGRTAETNPPASPCKKPEPSRTPPRPNPLLGRSNSPQPVERKESQASTTRGSKSPPRPNPLLIGSPQRQASRGSTAKEVAAANPAKHETASIGRPRDPSDIDTARTAASSRGKSGRRSSRRSTVDSSTSVFEPAAFLQSMVSAPSSAEVLASMFSSVPATEEQAPRRSTRRNQQVASEKQPRRSTTRESIKPGEGRQGARASTQASGAADWGNLAPVGADQRASAVQPRPVRSSVAASSSAAKPIKIAPWDAPSSPPVDTQSSVETISPGRDFKQPLASSGVNKSQRSPPVDTRSSVETISPGRDFKLPVASSGVNKTQRTEEAALESPVPPSPSFEDQTFTRTPSFDKNREVQERGSVTTSSPDFNRTAEFGDAPREDTTAYRARFGADRLEPRVLPRRTRSRSHEMPAGFMGSPGSANKVPLSALANRSPIVRLTRIQDLSLADRKVLVSKVPAFALLGQRLHEQRILRSRCCAQDLEYIALARWYAPYCALVIVYIAVLVAAGIFAEIVLLSIPLLIALPVLHLMRLAWSDHHLYVAVDGGALAEFQEQLKVPLGWGSNGVFAAALGSTVQAFQKPFPCLLGKPPLQPPLHPIVCGFVLLVALALVRVVRVALDVTVLEMEAAIAIVAMVLTVFIGCSPSGVRDRAWEADNRLMALEAGFNSMLDTLRPLMADLHGGFLPPPALPVPANPLLASMRFSVRLISTDRNTLRADLHVLCRDVPQVLVSCPLGSFTMHANVENAFPTELGVDAASPEMVPASLGSPSPSVGQGGQGLSAAAANAGIALGERRQRRRDDDEYSTSLASVSTASTLKGKRNSTQPTDVSLKLAMGMVASLNARHNEPLETFRSSTCTAVKPPKAGVDEFSLLLALVENTVQLVAGSELDYSNSTVSVRRASAQGWLSKRLRAVVTCCGHLLIPSRMWPNDAGATTSDVFGVLRSRDCLAQLCQTGSFKPQQQFSANFGTPLSRPPPSPLGRSTDGSDSDGYWSDEDKVTPTDSYLKAASETSKHLAVLFDSVEERDKCLSLLGMMSVASPGAHGEP